jgi:hypothetical protein
MSALHALERVSIKDDADAYDVNFTSPLTSARQLKMQRNVPVNMDRFNRFAAATTYSGRGRPTSVAKPIRLRP